MSPSVTPTLSLPDVLDVLREDITRRLMAGVGAALGALAPLAIAEAGALHKLVGRLGALLRIPSMAARLAEARTLGRDYGRERYLAGFGISSLVLEYGALREAILESLESVGWVPELAGLRALAQVLDAGLVEAVGQSSLEDERTARATGAWLHGLLDHAPTLIYAKDTAGRYLYVNHGFERASGKLRRDVMGRTDFDLFSAGGRQHLHRQ